MQITLYNQENFDINLEPDFDFFSKPFIVFDIFGKEKKTPEIIISRVSEEKQIIEFLNEKGLGVWAEKISNSEGWAKRQRVILSLKPMNLNLGKDFKLIKELPVGHFFEIDKANKSVRLCGNFIARDCLYTKWVYY